MVKIMLLLPPTHRETLTDIPEKVARKIVVFSVLEDLMVQQIMGEPAALLPEEAEEEDGESFPPECGSPIYYEVEAQGHQTQIEEELVGVEEFTGLKHILFL